MDFLYQRKCGSEIMRTILKHILIPPILEAQNLLTDLLYLMIGIA